MAFYFSKALMLFFRTFSFVFARLIINVYFVLFSMLIALAFILAPSFLNLASPADTAFLIAGLLVFLLYWHLFRKMFLYVLRSSGVVVISEYVFGRTVPVSKQNSFGFNLIKKKFSSLKNFREFEDKSIKVIGRIYGVLGFVAFIPNVTQAISSAVLSYVFADNKVESNTSLRDGLILFYQKKNRILFEVFAMQIFSYIIFLLSYLILFIALSPVTSILVYPFDLISFVMIFLILLLFYSSFVSHFLICWQSIYFIEMIRNDVASKKIRSLLEKRSKDFNEISAKSKVFIPLQTITSRNLMYSFDKTEKEKRTSLLVSLDGTIKDKDILEEETKGGEALSNLVSKVTEIKSSAKKKEINKKEEKYKERIFKKYRKEKEYNRIFNLLLEFLGSELGTKNKYQIVYLEKKEENWFAKVLINQTPFHFSLDKNGKILDFEEQEQ